MLPGNAPWSVVWDFTQKRYDGTHPGGGAINGTFQYIESGNVIVLNCRDNAGKNDTLIWLERDGEKVRGFIFGQHSGKVIVDGTVHD